LEESTGAPTDSVKKKPATRGDRKCIKTQKKEGMPEQLGGGFEKISTRKTKKIDGRK